jgi:hypothetical protein
LALAEHIWHASPVDVCWMLVTKNFDIYTEEIGTGVNSVKMFNKMRLASNYLQSCEMFAVISQEFTGLSGHSSHLC